MAHLQQVIVAEMRTGRGVEYDPIRMVQQFWSTDGTLLGEIDEYKRTLHRETIQVALEELGGTHACSDKLLNRLKAVSQ